MIDAKKKAVECAIKVGHKYGVDVKNEIAAQVSDDDSAIDVVDKLHTAILLAEKMKRTI